MTVIIEKPAINLREELADLRNQGTYQEQQFYFDGLVTNGTFDTDATGWSGARSNETLSVVSGRLRSTATAAGVHGASFPLTGLTIGNVYQLKAQVFVDGGTDPVFLRVDLGSNLGGAGPVNLSSTSNETYDTIFVATATTMYVGGINVAPSAGDYFELDNVSVYETDGTDVIHTMPKGWVPKDVFEDGLLQREGAANDYTVVYDGFDYYVKPAVAPSATTQTCVIGVRK